MTERISADSTSRPHLAPHRRLRFDQARGSWTIQAPERVFLLDEIAHAIISRCDGEKTISEIVDELCKAYGDAPREAIATDVMRLVQDFADKGVMAL
ncbi:MAG TPA: pyrroloquinoline quinone biosynthesis peptide chaperone PqqD [Rhizomicrobium sp.]|jgi:pyrroloquinoline quinone biosynthesis protein D|nr:pyrroloquinoline quinone biosynthesis peptide chaperone PqqD [Rhizomicrobium sp.]